MLGELLNKEGQDGDLHTSAARLVLPMNTLLWQTRRQRLQIEVQQYTGESLGHHLRACEFKARFVCQEQVRWPS